MRNGPVKIVLLNSGKYDYAEVELEGAVQIVGRNNTGKTTLINTLQFLYLDDQRRMDFGSYSLEQTLDYYFPGPYSYVLFECRTLRGQAVIGWRGHSKASGSGPERFCYLGPYQREDYFHESGQVREPRDLSGRLALKELQLLPKAQAHREVLLVAKSAQGQGLGIVSLKDNDKFPQFRETLKNLLSLSSITQDQMRDRLLMLAEIPPDAVAIDARQVLGQDHDRLVRLREELLLLKKHEGLARSLLEEFETREQLRGELVYRWMDLKGRKAAFEQANREQIAKLDARLEQARAAEAATRSELSAKSGERDRAIERRAVLRSQLDQLAKQGEEFSGFVLELERGALGALEQRIGERQAQLQAAATEKLEWVEASLETLGETLADKRRALEQFTQLVVTTLRGEFTDDELATLFAVFNPELLQYPLGGESIRVSSYLETYALLRGLLGRIEQGVYRDDRLTIRLRPARKTLADLASVEKVREEVEQLEREQQRQRRLREAIVERDLHSRQLAAWQVQRDEKARTLHRYEAFQEQRQKEPEWRQELAGLEQALRALAEATARLEETRAQANRTQNELAGQRREVEQQFKATMERFGRCVYPQFDVAPRADARIPDNFDEAIDGFVREQQHEFESNSQVNTLLLKIQGVFIDRFQGIDERQTLHNLREEIEALPDKEEALRKDWNNHLHGLKARFKHVLDDLDGVQSAKDALNRSFGDVQVSDLKAIKLTVQPQTAELSWIKRLAGLEELDLWADQAPLELALKSVRELLDRHPVILVAELFTLGVSVTRADGKLKHYADFRQIESDGTTVTLKVLFNLLVLKSLLRKEDVAVPFFLDEVEKLDPANRRAVLQTARALGFIAITAAPSAVGEVDACYFLEPQNGRVTLTASHCLKIKAKAPKTEVV